MLTQLAWCFFLSIFLNTALKVASSTYICDVLSNRLLLFFGLSVAALISSCGGRDYKPMAEYSGYTQGESYHIICDGEEGLFDEDLKKLLAGLDHSISVWDSMSLVSQFNRSATGIRADKHLMQAFELAKKIHQETDGAFNPAVYTLTQTPNKFGGTLSPPSDSLLKFSKFNDVYISSTDSSGKSYFIAKRHRQTKISFMGLGQGFAVDLISSFLEGKGIQNYHVTVGKITRAKGLNRYLQPWKTSIDKPTSAGEIREVQAIIPLGEKPYCVVGDYRDFYQNGSQRYNRYIIPETGKMGENTLLCVTVFASSAAEAEAYGTAFMVMGAGQTTQFLAKRKDLYAYLISSGFEEQDFQTWMSPELEKIIEENK